MESLKIVIFWKTVKFKNSMYTGPRENDREQSWDWWGKSLKLSERGTNNLGFAPTKHNSDRNIWLKDQVHFDEERTCYLSYTSCSAFRQFIWFIFLIYNLYAIHSVYYCDQICIQMRTAKQEVLSWDTGNEKNTDWHIL